MEGITELMEEYIQENDQNSKILNLKIIKVVAKIFETEIGEQNYEYEGGEEDELETPTVKKAKLTLIEFFFVKHLMNSLAAIFLTNVENEKINSDNL